MMSAMQYPKTTTAPGVHYDAPFARAMRLIADHTTGGNITALSARAGLRVKQSAWSRYARGAQDPTASTVLEIAEALGYEGWQMLMPDFDPRAAPPLLDVRAMRLAAIFAGLTSERDRLRLEAIAEQFANDPAPAPDAD